MNNEFTKSTSNADNPNPAVANLDEGYLSSTFGDDADFLAEVLETFISSSGQLQAQIRQAVAENDAGCIRALAHTLKGSSRMIGANLFAVHCQDMEVEDDALVILAAKRVLQECDFLLAECGRRLVGLRST